MCRVLHATVGGVGLGSSVCFSAGWIVFIWHLTEAFRHLTAPGWLAFCTGLSVSFLLPLGFVRGLAGVLCVIKPNRAKGASGADCGV
jgi:hypothetical protein